MYHLFCVKGHSYRLKSVPESSDIPTSARQLSPCAANEDFSGNGLPEGPISRTLSR
ncbi:MAG: hypothetical protein ACTXOO_02360 [Sodalis sp. (in: enterobacteria)]